MLFLDIVLHTFLIFTIQGLLYIFYISKIESDEASKLIAHRVQCQLYKMNPQYISSLQYYLPGIQFPQTCVAYDNKNWQTIIIIIVTGFFFFVMMCIFITKLYYPDVSIGETVFKNFAIFAVIGAIEYYFFIFIVLKYNTISINDVENAALNTLKTGAVQS